MDCIQFKDITQTQEFNITTLCIYSCNFLNCKNSGYYTRGGAIRFVSQNSNLTIHASTFDNCQSVSCGGAIFACGFEGVSFDSNNFLMTHENMNSFNSHYCCYSGCSAQIYDSSDGASQRYSGYGSAILVASDNIELNYSASSECPKSTSNYAYGAQFDLKTKDVKSCFINATTGNSICAAAIEYRNAEKGFFSYQTIVNQVGAFITSFSSLEGIIQISTCNLINNTLRYISHVDLCSLIYVMYKNVIVRDFVVALSNIDSSVNNNGKSAYFAAKNSNDVKVTVINCQIDYRMADSEFFKDIVTTEMSITNSPMTHTINQLNLGDCKGVVQPPSLFETNHFTSSDNFTSSVKFTRSENFQKTEAFSKSDHFSNSEEFTESYTYTHSNLFSKSEKFTDSEEFTKSDNFIDSGKFTKSDKFTDSEEFSKSDKFTYSEKFSKSDKFTYSEKFSKSDKFTYSEEFTKSESFTKYKSRSKFFTESVFFSASYEFSESATFVYKTKPTDAFSFSDQFTSSSAFSVSAKFTLSSHFSPSEGFTASTAFSRSSEFTKSETFSGTKGFSPSHPFTKTRAFAASANFTESSPFSPTASAVHRAPPAVPVNTDKSRKDGGLNAPMIGGITGGVAGAAAVASAAFFIIKKKRAIHLEIDIPEASNNSSTEVVMQNPIYGMNMSDDPFQNDFAEHLASLDDTAL